jgi:large subunit ribosomal protein L31
LLTGPVHGIPALHARHGAPTRTTQTEESSMKKDIHPAYGPTHVTCTCGNTFETRSTAKNGVIHAEVCSQCHPFYTGKQKILDTGGRVARFEARYGKKSTK